MIEHQLIIDRTIAFVKEALAGAEGGHDWYHIERVWKMARHIREKEDQGDLLTIELAALLHDISDPKFNGGDERIGSELAHQFLMQSRVGKDRADHIREIIQSVSFKGGLQKNNLRSIEFQIVQDADRLDAIGAIGIARAFNYGGFKNRPIYDPTIPLQEYRDAATYYQSGAPTINHFYEKLLKLKGLMNTGTGKSIAQERHAFMLQFLDTFYRECDPGKDH